MEYLSVKNWKHYQHYKDRCPPWIKLHVQLLNDREFTSLACASKGLLMLLWILASEQEGKIPADLEEIRFRLRDPEISIDDLKLLIDKGFLLDCKQALADASKSYSETEKKKTRVRAIVPSEDALRVLAAWAGKPLLPKLRDGTKKHASCLRVIGERIKEGYTTDDLIFHIERYNGKKLAHKYHLKRYGEEPSPNHPHWCPNVNWTPDEMFGPERFGKYFAAWSGEEPWTQDALEIEWAKEMGY